MSIRKALQFLLLTLSLSTAKADDGYRLWLKYDRLPEAQRQKYIPHCKFIVQNSDDEVLKTAALELQKGLEGLLGVKVPIVKVGITKGQILLVHNPTSDETNESFKISALTNGFTISGNKQSAVLYGVFAFLRKIQTNQDLPKIEEKTIAKNSLRMLNHWDNVLGTIERGYAGASLWKWYELPETIDPRYRDYARANASLGINAVSVNNVNASARFLTAEYLVKVKALADVFRPYGIKVFLSINFASPKILGKLKTSDPLAPDVRKWWADKTKEVYGYIPDFGGFLVKANSEGEPGPQEYGRTHADGANMLAEALKSFNGTCIWRAFVYSPNPKGDRFKEAYNEFKPLDGQFADNVIVQVKNGPIDFQPREPVHPLFGAMPKTPLALEFQITQEYLGFTTNLVYLGTLFKEAPPAPRGGAIVPSLPTGEGSGVGLTGGAFVGVANTGSDRNWTGHFMSQANWYAFGRLAWNPDLSAEEIAEEWIKMTLTKNPASVKIIKDLMMNSRENYVNFTTPLGLHHIMGQNIHFGPEPWLEKSARPDWTSIYYHRADSVGLGFDRTEKGSNALSLYSSEIQKQFSNPETCDLRYLLWFHHVAWNKKLSTGRTLWDELCERYYTGVESVIKMQQQWASVKKDIDPEIFADVSGRLAAQHREALNWRDACVLYFQQYAKMPIPPHLPKPTRTLDDMKELVRIYQLR